jgi:tetratricopeptide (TPR) repeat protein
MSISYDVSEKDAPNAVLNLIDRLWCAEPYAADKPTTSWDAVQAFVNTRSSPATVPPESIPIPDIPGYTDLLPIGAGGMGVVYRAIETTLKRPVALKVLREKYQQDALRLQRFRAEAQAAAQLLHPNIVQIFRVGVADGLPFLALELVEGGSLREHLDGQPQPPRVAAELIQQLALAIGFAHDKKLVHRDLKPENILLANLSQATLPARFVSPAPRSLLTGREVAKITDFGLVKQLDSLDNLTQTGWLVGTLHYAAPEQVSDKFGSVGPHTDIHALGEILYELLTGRRPFLAAELDDALSFITTQDPISPIQLQPKVPRDLAVICLKCLRKEATQRYATACDLAHDLGRFLDGKAILARPVSRWERLVKWACREPLVAGLFGAVILLVIGSMVGGFLSVKEIYRQRNDAISGWGEADRQTVVARRKEAQAIRVAQQWAKSQIWTIKNIDELGRVLSDRGEYERALAIFKTAAELFTGVSDVEPNVAIYHYEAAANTERAAVMLRSLERPEQSRDHFRQALQRYQRALELDANLTEAVQACDRVTRDLRDLEPQSELISLERKGTLALSEARYVEAMDSFDRGLVLIADLERGRRLDKLCQAARPGFEMLSTVAHLAPQVMEDTAIALRQPVPLAGVLLQHKASRLARQGNHREASNLANSLLSLRPEIANNSYYAACCWALCLESIAHGRPVDSLTDTDRLLMAKYRQNALAAVRHATELGFNDRSHLKSDPDLASLKDDPEFQKLIEE